MREFDEKLYIDAYCTKYESTVEKVEQSKDGYWVLLSDTIFYPEGGGQDADHGTLNDQVVLDVQRREDGIYHLVKQPFNIHEKVIGKIDWDFRFKNMQNHSGEHMVSGMIHQKFGYDNVGFHMGKECIQIDFDGVLTLEQAYEIEREVNDMISKNIPIEIVYPTEDELHDIPYRSKRELTGRVRIVQIEDCDICACCGTHVAYTGEIGLVKILSLVHHKDGVRIEMLAGKDALEYFERIHKEASSISTLLSLPTNQISSGVKKLLEDQKAQYQSYQQLQKKYFYARLQQEEMNQPIAIVFEEDIDRNAMITLCNMLMDERQSKIAMVCNGKEESFQFMMMSKCVDLQDVKSNMMNSLHLRAGGKKEVLQGSIQDSKDTIQNVMTTIINEKNISYN